MGSTTCPEGHENPLDASVCETCGAALVPDHEDPPTESRRARFLSGGEIGFIGFVAVLLVIVGVIVASSNHSDRGSGRETVRTTEREPATTTSMMSTVDVCTVQLAGWLDYLSSTEDTVGVASEFGTQSPEWKVITDAYRVWATNRFSVGNDAASEAALNVIERDCRQLGNRYTIHEPPG